MPMGPVLLLGLHRVENPLIHKQIIVYDGKVKGSAFDDVLMVPRSLLNGKVSLNRQEDLLP